MAKLPVKTTKINTQTGSGTPGGFSGQAGKVPTAETKKYTTAIATLSSQLAQLNSLSANDPAAALILKPIKDKLTVSMNTYSKKMTETKKSAPDFTKPTSIPTLPTKPEIDIPKLDIPNLPTDTEVSNTPSAPAVSTISSPKIGP